MCRAVNRVNFNCGNYIKAGLLKSKRQAARTRKKIDPDGAMHICVRFCHIKSLTSTSELRR